MPLKIAGKKVELHIKRYNYQNIFYALKNLFRTSRGKRVWKVANGWVLRNIPTPLPVAFLEQRKGRLLIKSFFITQKIDHSLPLTSLLQKGAANSPEEISKIRDELLQQGAHILRMMHTRGVCHGDLKASNILVRKKAGQKEKLYLVDLDSARVKKSVKEDDKIRDLARLNASLLDTRAVSPSKCLRLLHYYLRHTGDQKGEEYWKTILERTQNKLKKTGRKFT
jgi:tRNA A-37 threonylcarbamoyl transferase component Bud32